MTTLNLILFDFALLSIGACFGAMVMALLMAGRDGEHAE